MRTMFTFRASTISCLSDIPGVASGAAFSVDASACIVAGDNGRGGGEGVQLVGTQLSTNFTVESIVRSGIGLQNLFHGISESGLEGA